MKKDERGSLVIEATYVFPIMFFILFFLIYMGNMFYMRSQVDAIVTEEAIKAAANCADPFLETVRSTGSVPKTIDDIQPYHSIFGGSSQDESRVESAVRERLERLGTGYFAGMNLRDVSADCNFRMGLLASSVTVEANYRIKFPIRFLGSSDPSILRINSRATVPVTDTPEFILNVDMAMDFLDTTSIPEKLEKLGSEVSKFLGR